jgi:MFS family permease
MRVSDLKRSAPVAAQKGQTLQGFAYAWHTPVIRTVLLMMALVGTLSYEFSVSLPLLAHFTFNGSEAAVAAAVALMMTTMGIGAVIGGLVTAGKRAATMRALTFGAFGFGVAMAFVAIAPTIAWVSGGMAVVGYFSVAFTAHTNTMLQTSAAPHMRGRVMALWAMAFMGATVIGAPIIGWVGQNVSPQWGLGIGALASVAAGVTGLLAQRGPAVVTELPKRVVVAEKESA